jgi:hypothetical protein
VTCEIRAHRPGPVSNTGQLISQLRLIEHFSTLLRRSDQFRKSWPVRVLLVRRGTRPDDRKALRCAAAAPPRDSLLLLVRFSNLVLAWPLLVLTLRLPGWP